MFANTQMMGLNLGMPDVTTPNVVPSAPVPVPYPNMSPGSSTGLPDPLAIWQAFSHYTDAPDAKSVPSPMKPKTDNGSNAANAAGMQQAPSQVKVLL